MSNITRDFDRKSMGLVALLLPFIGVGALCVHKFLMGRTKQGIICIVLSLLTCGAFGWVVSLVEGIIYLTKTDSEFQRDYVYGNKDWF
jgi:TM2 domain-containing membrane protein YozV